VPWWANLAWLGVFLVLLQSPRRGVVLAVPAWALRVSAVLSSIGTVWMLSGLGWFSVMAFYAMTALWPVLLFLLWRGKATALAGWMIPLAVLEGAGALGSLAAAITGALLGAPRFELRSATAAAFAIGQVFFLFRTARVS
jgi:hypothetical protein